MRLQSRNKHVFCNSRLQRYRVLCALQNTSLVRYQTRTTVYAINASTLLCRLPVLPHRSSATGSTRRLCTCSWRRARPLWIYFAPLALLLSTAAQGNVLFIYPDRLDVTVRLFLVIVYCRPLIRAMGSPRVMQCRFVQGVFY